MMRPRARLATKISKMRNRRITRDRSNTMDQQLERKMALLQRSGPSRAESQLTYCLFSAAGFPHWHPAPQPQFGPHVQYLIQIIE